MTDSSALWSRINAIPTVTSTVNVGSMTSPAPLPTDCLSSLWNFQTLPLWPFNPFSWTAYTLGCAVSSCCPGSQQPYSEPYQWLTTYHSPAVCPREHKTCPGPGNLTPGPGETLAFCCPGKVFQSLFLHSRSHSQQVNRLLHRQLQMSRSRQRCDGSMVRLPE